MPEEIMDTTNALGFLRQEHAVLQELIRSCMESDDPVFRADVFEQIKLALKVHAAMESEYFYPFMGTHFDAETIWEASKENGTLDALSTATQNELEKMRQALANHIYLIETKLFVQATMKDPYFDDQLVLIANKMKKRKRSLLEKSNTPATEQTSAGGAAEAEPALLNSGNPEETGEQLPSSMQDMDDRRLGL